MKLGRPRKYENKNALKKEIEKYFNSISCNVPVTIEGAPVCNDDGEKIYKRQYFVPPSVSGLCVHLGIDRSTWNNYCDLKLHPEFAEVCNQTRGLIEAYLEEQLIMREKNVQGIMFNLQHNYDWKDKKEVEMTGDGVSVSIKRIE